MEKQYPQTHTLQKLGVLKIQVLTSYIQIPCTSLYDALGTETWPVGVYLQFIGGDKMGQFESIALPPLAPGQLHDINVDLISPSEPGLYQSQWQICTPNGIISAGIHSMFCM